MVKISGNDEFEIKLTFRFQESDAIPATPTLTGIATSKRIWISS